MNPNLNASKPIVRCLSHLIRRQVDWDLMRQSVLRLLLVVGLLSACGAGNATSPTTPATATTSYVSGSALLVPPNTIGSSQNVVNGQRGTITDLHVSVSITSPQGLCILFLTLHHPDGSRVMLKFANQGPGSSCTETQWVTTYPTQTTPWESLDRLFGKPAEGTWELRPDHQAKSGFNVRLDNWTLRITTRS